MFDFLTSLPIWMGVPVSVLVACGAGVAAYAISDRRISSAESAVISDAAASLFGIVGVALALVLTLAFERVVDDWGEVEGAINAEAIAVSDTLGAFELYNSPDARSAQATLLAYVSAVIDDEWLALASDQLSERAGDSFRQLVGEVLALTPENQIRQDLRASILDDIDAMSDARQERLNGALAQPRVFYFLAFFAFLVTMVLFGAYESRPALVVLVLIYAAFIGLTMHLILAVSDPFQGVLGIDPDQLMAILERQAAAGPGG